MFNLIDNISKKDIGKYKSKRTIIFCKDSKELFYISQKLEIIKIPHGKIIKNDELPYNTIPNFIYIIKSDKKCKVYSYNHNTQKHFEITQNDKLIETVNSIDPIMISTLSDDSKGGYAPATSLNMVKTMDGKRNAQSVVDKPLGQYIGKYDNAIRYIEIDNPTVRIYNVPAPIPGMYISETSMFLMFVGDKQIDPSEYTLLDNDYQIQFHDTFQLVQGMKILCLFGFHRVIDTSIIKIAHGNLNDEMGIEWENAQRHLNNFENPHRVHKTHVSLGQVANYPVASNTEAIEGSSDERYMTPLKTKLLINDMIGKGYIEYGSYLIRRHEWTYMYLSESTTTYNIPPDYYDPTVDSLDIFMYGLKLEKGVDYNIISRTVTLISKIELNSPLVHIIEKVVPNTVDRTPVELLKSTIRWTATEDSRDTFDLPLDRYTRSCVAHLYLEGIRMVEGTDYQILDNIVTLTEPIDIGQTVTTYIYETEVEWTSIKDRPIVVNDLTSTSASDSLSAAMGKKLYDMINRQSVLSSMLNLFKTDDLDKFDDNNSVKSFRIDDENDIIEYKLTKGEDEYKLTLTNITDDSPTLINEDITINNKITRKYHQMDNKISNNTITFEIVYNTNNKIGGE